MTAWLTRSALNFMQSESRSCAPLESGGVLLGWRRGNSTVVAVALGPGPAALHGRYLFVPDDNWDTEQVKNAFAKSGGDLNYLGDWHSHPNGTAETSSKDKSTLTRIARRIGKATMIIVAGDLTETSPVGCWLGHRSGRWFGGVDQEPDELRILEASDQSWPSWNASYRP